MTEIYLLMVAEKNNGPCQHSIHASEDKAACVRRGESYVLALTNEVVLTEVDDQTVRIRTKSTIAGNDCPAVVKTLILGDQDTYLDAMAYASGWRSLKGYGNA